MDPLYWQLEYGDGGIEREPLSNSSVRSVRSGARDLIIIKADNTPIVRVPLVENLHMYKPIFYRRRYMSPGDRHTKLEATVFGRAYETGSRIDSQLWAAIEGRIVDCPGHLIDARMIQLQVEEVH